MSSPTNPPTDNKENNIDWNKFENCENLFEKMFSCQVPCDIEFYLESEARVVPAHKLIIGTGSEVLHRFVYGSDSIKASSQITLKNISYEQFYEVLQYIYNHKANITIDNAFPIMGAASYLQMNGLQNVCSNILIPTLNLKKACDYYEEFLFKMDNKFTKHCANVICINGNELIKSKDILKMNKNVLMQLLKMDGFNVDHESTLFKMILDVAANNSKMDPTLNCKIFVEEVCKHIRFPTMQANDFIYCINLNKDFFSNKDISDIMMYIALQINNQSSFSNIPRLKYEVARNEIIQLTCKTCYIKTGRGSSEYLALTTSNQITSVLPVVVVGFEVWGSSLLAIEHNEHKLIYNRENSFSNNQTWKIIFETQIAMLPGKQHTFKFLSRDKEYLNKTQWDNKDFYISYEQSHLHAIHYIKK